jgi:hypothetical protein
MNDDFLMLKNQTLDTFVHPVDGSMRYPIDYYPTGAMGGCWGIMVLLFAFLYNLHYKLHDTLQTTNYTHCTTHYTLHTTTHYTLHTTLSCFVVAIFLVGCVFVFLQLPFG